MTNKFVPAGEFAKTYFAPPPDPRTVRSWIDTGKVPGKKIGSLYYVDVGAFLAGTGNALADRVLKAAGYL